MKKFKISIFIIIMIIVLLISVILFLNISKKNLASDADLRNEIETYINFKMKNYISIEDVFYYESNLKINNTLKKNFYIIASELKRQYPGKSILYVEDYGNRIPENLYKNLTGKTREEYLKGAEECYKCMQISKGRKINYTDMYAYVYEDGRVEFKFVYYKKPWKDDEIENFVSPKITYEEAKNIAIDYLVEHIEEYRELKNNFFVLSNENCIVDLYYYNGSTISWKMQFNTGNSYMIIDANNGNILEKYFFSGVIVN